MGCNPLGKMISMACGRNGGGGRSRSKERRSRSDEQDHVNVGYISPSITAVRSTYGHPMVKSVIYSENSPKIVTHPDNAVFSFSGHACSAEMTAGAAEPRRLARVRFATPHDHSEGKNSTGGSQQQQVVTTPVGEGGGVASAYRYMMPSPLPANHVDRLEYFGGDHRYYPTPIRESIYRLATDTDRLTTMFSEENPNACSII